MSTIKRAKKGLVLAVDDDPDVRVVFERALSSWNGTNNRQSIGKVRLLAAADVAGGQVMIDHESVAVAFIDKNLPDGDGVSFCRELVGVVDFPCYVITGTGSSEDALKALEDGVAEYIPKPIKIEKIRDIVRRHVLVDKVDEPTGA